MKDIIAKNDKVLNFQFNMKNYSLFLFNKLTGQQDLHLIKPSFTTFTEVRSNLVSSIKDPIGEEFGNLKSFILNFKKLMKNLDVESTVDYRVRLFLENGDGQLVEIEEQTLLAEN